MDILQEACMSSYAKGYEDGQKQFAAELIKAVEEMVGLDSNEFYAKGENVVMLFKDDTISLIKKMGGIE